MFLRLFLGWSDRARDTASRADADRVVGMGLQGTRPGPAPLCQPAAEPADREPGPGGDRVADGKVGRVLRARVPEGPLHRRDDKEV